MLALAACGGEDGEVMGPPAPQPAAGLAFVDPPSGATAGEEIAPGVQVAIQDASGNRVTDATDAVTVELAENPAGGTLLGTRTVNAVDGVATFADLAIERAGDGYRLGVTSGGLDEALSEAFAITPAEPAELVMLSEPGTGEGQAPFDPAVEVAIQDEFGNVVTGAPADVTVALSATPSGEALGGTTTVPAVDGVAVFDDLSLALPGDGFVLEASSGSLPPVASADFSVRLTFVQLSAGDNHTCGVTAGEFAYCWGENELGQLGDGTTDNRNMPTPVAGGFRFARVSAGYGHTCGLATAEDAYCWGENVSGELGDGTTENRHTPTRVEADFSFAQVSSGGAHTCGVTTGGIAYCWGSDIVGELGNGPTTGDKHTPTPVAGDFSFAQISAGDGYTCGVSTGEEGYCWGGDTFGRLGNGSMAGATDMPMPILGGLSFAEVNARSGHTCGLTTGEEVYCWGADFFGQLGNGPTTGDQHTPTSVPGFSFARVSAGHVHTCGVTTGGTASCWGRNLDGQLGDGTTGNRDSPTSVLGGLSFVQISAGIDQTCGITAGSIAYCWGSNSNGQLGDGESGDDLIRDIPRRVVQ